MSGRPTASGVRELRDALRDLRTHAQSVDGLKERLQECQVNLPIEQEKAAKAHRRVIEALEKMDCKSPGNTGWEGRISTMLMELDGQSQRELPGK